jgi:hypothetical protein
MAENRKLDVQLALLAEHGAALRARSMAEYLFATAAVGSFGAVCWGVAALDNKGWLPAVVAAIGIVGVAATVLLKIQQDHLAYNNIKIEQIKLAEELEATYNMPVLRRFRKEELAAEELGIPK